MSTTLANRSKTLRLCGSSDEIEPENFASRFSLRRGPRSLDLRSIHLYFLSPLLAQPVESGALKPLVDARDFELTTAGVGDIVKASMTHRTKGKLVLTVSKQ